MKGFILPAHGRHGFLEPFDNYRSNVLRIIASTSDPRAIWVVTNDSQKE